MLVLRDLAEAGAWEGGEPQAAGKNLNQGVFVIAITQLHPSHPV